MGLIRRTGKVFHNSSLRNVSSASRNLVLLNSSVFMILSSRQTPSSSQRIFWVDMRGELRDVGALRKFNKSALNSFVRFFRHRNIFCVIKIFPVNLRFVEGFSQRRAHVAMFTKHDAYKWQQRCSNVRRGWWNHK